MDPVDILPYEIIIAIFSLLGIQTIKVVSLVSTAWKRAAHCPDFWTGVFARLTLRDYQERLCYERLELINEVRFFEEFSAEQITLILSRICCVSSVWMCAVSIRDWRNCTKRQTP